MDYKNKIQHDEIEKDLNHIRDFICLATSEPVYLDTIFSRGKDGFNESEILFKRKYNIKNFDKHPLKQILYFEDIEKEYNNVLQKWFEDYEQLKHIYEMFFLTIYAPSELSFKFLSLAQALDSYTWIHIKNKSDYSKEKTKLLTTEEFARRKSLIIENIPDNEPEGLKEWIENQLDNAIGFKERLSILFEDYDKIFNNIDNKEIFIKALVETRNAISHGYSEEQYKKNKYCYRNNDLYLLFYGAKMILTTVFLRKIGFRDEKILDCLKRINRYSSILEGKYKYEEKKGN